MLLSSAVAKALTLLSCCCHGFSLVLQCCYLSLLPWSDFVIVVVLPHRWCVIFGGDAVVLLCCCRAGALWSVYDLCPCRSSCPPPAAGHWVTFTPPTGLLSTLLFLPLDSSIFLTKLGHRSSTLFLLWYFLSHDFFLSQGESVVCKCLHFPFNYFLWLILHLFLCSVCSEWLSVCLSPHQRREVLLLDKQYKTNVTVQTVPATPNSPPLI